MDELASDAAVASAIVATVSAIAATVSAACALITIVAYRRASQGKPVVTWRLREPGVPVIDVLVRNIGASPVYDRVVHVPRLEKPIAVPVLSPGAEIIIATLVGRDGGQTYRVMRNVWWWPRPREEASTTIDPKSLTGMKLGGHLPLTRIATMLEHLEKKIGDVPVFRNAIERIGISRDGEEEWLLPPGVRGVLLPSSTERRGIHTDSEMGDTDVRRAVNDEVVHQPQQMLRIVMDGTITEDEAARIRNYLDLGSEVTFHWHAGRLDFDVSYIVLGKSGGEAPARILERTVKFVQRGDEDAQ